MVKTFEANIDTTLKIGASAELAGYSFTLDKVEEVRGPNYAAARATVSLSRAGVALNTLHPEKRIYLARQMPMTESSIDVGLFRDVYVSLGDAVAEDSWVVRLYYKPFISWIWAGCLLMALGGVLAALDSRYRKQKVAA